MIDAIWMLWSRALLDYANAATTWSLIRMRRTAMIDVTDQTMKTTAIERGPRTIARKIVYVVAALVFTAAVGVFVIGVYTILTSLFHS
jgi:hypothetical protein